MTLKNVSLSILFLILFPTLSLAQNFSAQVDQTEIGPQETFTLNLQLEGTSSKDPPDLTVLDSDFQILGRQNGSTTTITNGHMTSSVNWVLTLMPNRKGTLTIPAITISTNAGTLSTQPIKMVVHDTATSNGQNNNAQLSNTDITVTANKTTLYKNERVLVTYELASNLPLQNIQITNLAVKDAIVEKATDPKIGRNGKNQQTMTISFWITPLKDQTLKVPPLMIRAEVPENSGGAGDDVFDDDNLGSSFAQMQQHMQQMMKQMGRGGFGFFRNMRPIVVSSQPLELQVLPAIPGMIPWLPTTDLSLSETWSGDAKVGEPMYRTIITRANGLSSTQLPGFEDQFNSNENQKVYSDPPEKSEENVGGDIFGVRKDKFTVVPQKAGEIRLPAIELTWWDTASRSKKTARIPEKIIQAAPGANGITSLVDQPQAQTQSDNKEEPIETTNVDHTWMWIVAALVAVGAAWISIVVWRRNKKSQGNAIEVQIEKLPLVQREDLQQCDSVESIYRFLQKYAQSNWKTSANLSPSKIFQIAKPNLTNLDEDEAERIARTMESNLYGRQQIDLEKLREDLKKLISKVEYAIPKNKTFEALPSLNP